MIRRIVNQLVLAITVAAVVSGCSGRREITWRIDNLEHIGGIPVVVAGQPGLIETPGGRAVEFDGVDDALFIEAHPLQGLAEFTVEVEFRPYAGGSAEQRFFHMQEDGSESRVMFETRLVEGEQWFLDTYIRSGDASVTLYAGDDLHPIGPWYHVAIVVGDGRFRHYVNGQLELDQPLQYVAQGPGRTSLGVRINRVHWFRGAIRTVHVSPRALGPAAFRLDLPD